MKTTKTTKALLARLKMAEQKDTKAREAYYKAVATKVQRLFEWAATTKKLMDLDRAVKADADLKGKSDG